MSSCDAILRVWDLELETPEHRLALIWIANASGGLGYPVYPDWIDLGVFMTCGYERASVVVCDLVDRGLLRWGGQEGSPNSYLYITYDGEYFEPVDWMSEIKGRSRRVAALIERDGPNCSYCGRLPVNYEVDHFIPRAKGGADTMSNLVLACAPCNRAKRDKLPEIFLLDKPDLYRVLKTNLACLHA